MSKRCLLSLELFWWCSRSRTYASQRRKASPHIRVVVDLVQLNVAVTDKKGNYVTGLRPQDFAIVEDGIPQKLATFAEGNESARRVLDLTARGKDCRRACRSPARSRTARYGRLVAGRPNRRG